MLAIALNLGACAAGPGSSVAGSGATVTEPESASVSLSGITPTEAERLIEIARGDPWLQDELDATDNRVVQVLDPGKGGGPIVWFVDYTSRRALASTGRPTRAT